MAFHDADGAIAIGVAAEHRSHMDKSYRSQYKPDDELSARELAALKKSLRITASKDVLLDAHPRWKEHGAAAKRKAPTPSTVGEQLQAWLRSNRG